jgi:hypothetical protein
MEAVAKPHLLEKIGGICNFLAASGIEKRDA